MPPTPSRTAAYPITTSASVKAAQDTRGVWLWVREDAAASSSPSPSPSPATCCPPHVSARAQTKALLGKWIEPRARTLSLCALLESRTARSHRCRLAWPGHSTPFLSSPLLYSPINRCRCVQRAKQLAKNMHRRKIVGVMGKLCRCSCWLQALPLILNVLHMKIAALHLARAVIELIVICHCCRCGPE